MAESATTAIYTVRQHGQDAQFYSYCAGGFSYPFYVSDWLNRVDFDLNRHRLEEEKLPVAALLPQLRGDRYFPEAAKGMHLFRPVSDSEAAAHLGRTAENERIPFHITLDMDRDMVCFAFNRECPELDLPDVELPMNGRHSEFGGAMLQDIVTCEEMGWGDDLASASEMREAVYERLICEHIAEQTQASMGMQMT